jgi:preprotein translocase subunit SecG
MQTVLLIIQLLVSISLVVCVLLQRSEGGALGMGSSGSGIGGLFSPRGAANTLTRTTAILAVLFFATSLGLTVLALRTHPQATQSILDKRTPGAAQPFSLPKAAKPQAPAVPKPQ